MDCKSLQELFVEYQLGELDEGQVDAIERHISNGCEECEREMSSILIGIDLLFEAAPSTPVSQARLTKIVERAKRSQYLIDTGSGTAVLRNSMPQYALTISAYVGSLAAGLLFMMAVSQSGSIPISLQNDRASSNAHLPPSQARTDSLDGQGIVPSDFRMVQPEYRTTEFVSLGHPPSQFRATAVWDPLVGEIHFFGFQFPPAPIDRDYILWVEQAGTVPIAIQTLRSEENGSCFFTIKTPLVTTPRLFVTLEPKDAPVKQPSDDLQLWELQVGN